MGEKYEQRNNKMQKRMRLLDEARAITHLSSLRKCGAVPLAGAIAVTQKHDGSGGFSGLFRCGSIWSCPECMPVIRQDRAALMETYALAWSTEHSAELCTGDPEDAGKTHAGHGMAMATFTSRHGQHAVLEDRVVLDKHGKPVLDDNGKKKIRKGQLQRTADAWRRMLQSRWWKDNKTGFRTRYGLVGATRALEVTHSWGNGWHTHIHSILWFEDPVTDEVAKQVEAELYDRWEAECRHAKLGRPTRKNGVQVDPARRGAEGAKDLAKYIVKVQDKDVDEDKPAAGGADVPVNEVPRGQPTPDQARRLADAKSRRDKARRTGRVRAEAEADSLIADIREEIGQAQRARALGNELLRGDNKTGRKSGRTPMEILRLALTGQEAELDVWHEYERATKGSRMLTWTGDVRDRLKALTGAEERDDQAVVYEEDQKAVKAVLVQVEPEPWKEKVAARPGRRGQVRVAVKVAADHAMQSGADIEQASRTAVCDILESWGLVPGTDFYRPGDLGQTGVDTLSGEIVRTPDQAVVPVDRDDRRRPTWETPDSLEANAGVIGMRPRDYVRPEQARRRAKGLPVARELASTTRSTESTLDTPICTECGGRIEPSLLGASSAGTHILCD
ncbi:hypothetical protein ACFCXP_37645 [Streptomyces niveus]|uniref:hypothetical protein n=1 Tax=Streptomyces niveus TaxID=193462 RepID=UPI0035D9C942